MTYFTKLMERLGLAPKTTTTPPQTPEAPEVSPADAPSAAVGPDK
jgi:hypothetical protein